MLLLAFDLLRKSRQRKKTAPAHHRKRARPRQALEKFPAVHIVIRPTTSGVRQMTQRISHGGGQ